MRLENKVALVTGGSSGIGEAACHALAAEGAHVAVVASRTLERARLISDSIRGNGGRAHPFACDIRRAEHVNKLVLEITEACGEVDILVNSAGLFYPTIAGATTSEDIDRIVDLNVKGTFHCINALVPVMKRRGGGKIVSITSVAGAVMGVTNHSLYCATKAAIALMTKSLGRELAGYNINVNAVAPGSVQTPMNETLRTAEEFKPMLEGLISMTPSRTKFSSPLDIARLIVFLVSDEARLMHGSVVIADEGLSAGL